MNPGGLVLIGFGVLGLCQLFGGDVLKRLRILPDTAGSAPAKSSTPATPPAQNPDYGSGAGPDLPAPPLLGPGGVPPTAPSSPGQPAGLAV